MEKLLVLVICTTLQKISQKKDCMGWIGAEEGGSGWMPCKVLPDSHVCEGATTNHAENPSFELGCVSRSQMRSVGTSLPFVWIFFNISLSRSNLGQIWAHHISFNLFEIWKTFVALLLGPCRGTLLYFWKKSRERECGSCSANPPEVGWFLPFSNQLQKIQNF